MVELLKPARGGFLRPFGCGWFIREYLLGRGPGGSRVIEPERGAPQAAGVSIRKVWKAEVLDIGKLVKAIADGKAPLVCVEPNESQCNKLAAAFGGQNPPPGLRFYQDEQTSARKVK